MKITLKWLKKQDACCDGVAWFKAQKERDAQQLIKTLMTQRHYAWANWCIVRIMDPPQRLAYSIFAAELVRKAAASAAAYATNRAAYVAANPTANAAYVAAYAAVDDATNTDQDNRFVKILNYGLSLLANGGPK